VILATLNQTAHDMQQMMVIARSPPGDLASVEEFQECPRDDRWGLAESSNLSVLNMSKVVNLNKFAEAVSQYHRTSRSFSQN
jgi:hypothetical protein